MPETVQALKRPLPEVTNLDWSYLDRLVRDVTSKDIPVPAKFALYVIRTLFSVSEEDACDAITDGANDRGIDAVVTDSQSRTIHLLQFKYREAPDHVSKQFPGNSVDKIISFVDDLLKRRTQSLDGCNRLLAAKITEIWDLIGSEPADIHIHLASNARKLDSKDRARLENCLKEYQARLWEHGPTDLVAPTIGGRKNRRRVLFQNGRLELTSDGKRMIVGVVELSDIAELLSHLEVPSQLDQTLFSDNVRGALGMDNPINRAIEKTIFTPDAANFVFYNNGITIVADQLLYQASGNFPVEMVNPQIVNGCQTASVIHQAFQTDRFVGDRTSTPPGVQVRIIESSDTKFREQVALATNSQTRIYGRDLRAVDQTQIKIERALRSRGYAYTRKRSDVSDAPASQTIDMARLSQLILAYYRKQPETAKTSNEIFGDLYDVIFDLSFLTVERMVAVHILHRIIDDRRQLARHKLRTAGNRYHEEWILEGHLHVLFVLGLICDRDEIDLVDIKGAAMRVAEAVQIVADFAAKHANVAAYRLFRTIGTSEALGKLVPSTKKQERGIAQGDLFSS